MPTIYEFGPFILDLDQGQLLRDGAAVPIRPKTWAVLRHLVENAGRLVSKDALLDAVWPGVMLNEQAAAQHVREVRDILGDARRSPQYIAVVPRRGFRFVATVHARKPAAEVVRIAPAPVASTSSLQEVWLALGLADPDAGHAGFVGRARELAEMRAALERVSAGQPIVVAVAGEPGIGKSQLLGEAARLALATGFQVAVGRCFEATGVPPFWPWAQIVRAIVQRQPPGWLQTTLGPGYADLAHFLPDLVGAATPPTGSTARDDQQARFRLVDSVFRTLRAAAAQQPLALLIDDLQWADSASLALLQLITGSSTTPLIVIGAYRDELDAAGHELPAILAPARRAGRLVEMTLAGLDGAQTATLLQIAGGGDLHPTLIRTLCERSGGNPYFVGELWRHLVNESAVAQCDGVWQETRGTDSIPHGVRATIELRLRHLEPGCVPLLSAAAVAGIEFDVRLASSLAAMEVASALAAIEAALRAHLVVEIPDRPGWYRFTHALVHETLYAGLSLLRRTHLHWRAGEELERRAATHTDETLVTLAYHFAKGASVDGWQKAVEYLRRAGAQATAGCGYEAATEQLERALAIIARYGGSEGSGESEGQRCTILIELGESYARAGQGRPAAQRFKEATHIARRLGQPDWLARAAFGLAARWAIDDSEVVEILEEVLQQARPAETALRARLQARLARTLYLTENSRARREALCSEALALARRAGDPECIGAVLADSLEALFHADTLSEQDKLANILFGIASSAGDSTLKLSAHAWRIVASMCRGRLHDADTELDAFLALATAVRQPRFVSLGNAFQAALLTARGDLARAETRARDAARDGAQLSEYDAGLIGFTQLFTIRREQGRTLELASDDQTIHAPDPDDPSAALLVRSAIWQLPFALHEQGNLDQAQLAFAARMADLDNLPPENSRNFRVMSLASMSDIAAALQDRAAAARLLPLAQTYAGQWVVCGFGLVIAASLHNTFGNLAAALGQRDEAAAHFDRAIVEHDREGAPVAQARTLHNYARMLVQRGRKHDRAQATALVDRALDISHRHGLVASMRKLEKLRVLAARR